MFSTAVKLANLDDYLEASQDCIVSLISDKDDTKPKIAVMKPAKTQDIKDNNKLVDSDKATVNVADCLACSGCVTSAETKLLQNQSVTEFMNQLKQKRMTVISISNQSCSSFASQLNCDLRTVQRKLSGLFKHIGAKFVMNSTISEYISLLETKYEFISRYKENLNLPMFISHCPGWICYSEKSLNNSVIPLLSKVRSAQQLQGILIKTLTLEIYNQLLLLYKFRLVKLYGAAKSIKSTLTKNDDFVDQKDIFHVAIMPCHDKKLESTRSSLSMKSFDGNSTLLEVDIVLATSEVTEIINLAGFDSLLDVPEAPLDNLWLNQKFQMTNNSDQSLLITENHEDNQILNQFCWLIPSFYNSSSGGFCEYIIRSAIKEIGGDNINKRIQLPFKQLISDILEAKYINNNFELKYCLAYGFKAIQSISRKLNLQRSSNQNLQSVNTLGNNTSYHLIEAMACPGGCISGGGQILLKSDVNDEGNSEVNNLRKNIKFIEGVHEKFYKGIDLNNNCDIILPDEIPIVNILYEYLIHIDKQVYSSSGFKLPFLRNDFSSFGETPTASSLKW